MNPTLRLCGVLLCAASLSACATVTRGTKQNYVIETDPEGAQIALSTGQTCTSPCRLKLPRRAGFTVTATHEGYEQAQANVGSRVRAGGGAAAAGNILFGGLIGAAVDSTNGSMNDLTPNPLRISMVPVAVAAAAEEVPAEVTAEAAPAAEVPAAEAPAEPIAEAPAPTAGGAEASPKAE